MYSTLVIVPKFDGYQFGWSQNATRLLCAQRSLLEEVQFTEYFQCAFCLYLFTSSDFKKPEGNQKHFFFILSNMYTCSIVLVCMFMCLTFNFKGSTLVHLTHVTLHTNNYTIPQWRKQPRYILQGT